MGVGRVVAGDERVQARLCVQVRPTEMWNSQKLAAHVTKP